MGPSLQELLAIIRNGLKDANKELQEARERRFTEHENDRKTTLAYERAIDYELQQGNQERAALIAVEAKQYSKAIELYAGMKHWEDAAFAAKIAGKCDTARDFYRKAGNDYYARRMQDNINAAKKTA